MTPIETRPAQPTRTKGPARPDWLPLEEFPFEVRWLDLEGLPVPYVDEGEGPPLLFVHVGPAWCFVFRDLILALRDRFRCVTFDLPGTGLAAGRTPLGNGAGNRPSGGDGATDRAARVGASLLESASGVVRSLLERLNLDEVVIVGHDLGGPVSFPAAALARSRIRGLVVVGSFGWSLATHQPKAHRMLGFVGGPLFGALNRTTNALARLSSTRFGVGRRLSAEGRRVYRAPARWHDTRRLGTRLLGDAASRPGVRYLESVEALVRGPLSSLPWLLLYGERDPGRKLGFQRMFERILPNATSEVIAEARHFPTAEYPAHVADSIRRWYDSSFGDPFPGDDD